MTGRRLERAARRFADQQPASRSTSGPPFATVTAVTPGAGLNGGTRLTVRWGGQDLLVRSFNAAYTPAVGDRVRCAIVRSQLVVEGVYI